MHSGESHPPVNYVAPTQQQLEAAQAFVNRWADRWSRPDPDALRELMHADTKNLIPPMTEPADREGVVRHFAAVLRRLPDLRLDVLRWGLTGDTVMIEWRANATAMGQQLQWTGVDVMRLRGERTYAAEVYWDTRKVDQQISALREGVQGGSGVQQAS
jgi:ketosteroid isomerase-like protein